MAHLTQRMVEDIRLGILAKIYTSWGIQGIHRLHFSMGEGEMIERLRIMGKGKADAEKMDVNERSQWYGESLKAQSLPRRTANFSQGFHQSAIYPLTVPYASSFL